jgi:hypothetical protein
VKALPARSIFLLLLLFPFCLFSQDEPLSPQPRQEVPAAPKQYYLLSPRVSVTVPHPTGNNSFKRSFVGIYEVSAGLNLMVYKGAFIGASYKNGLLKITENKIIDYNASMAINNAAVRVGGDAFIGDKNRTIFSASVAVGQNWTKYSGLVSKDPNRIIPSSYVTTFVEPQVDLFFLIEANFGIGASLSYSFYNKNFDPFELALNEYANFDNNVPGITRYISFGFGFYYSVVKKKK